VVYTLRLLLPEDESWPSERLHGLIAKDFSKPADLVADPENMYVFHAKRTVVVIGAAC
jgi:hypothetical protein